MTQKILGSINRVPTPMAGLALGIASLGACLEHFGHLHGIAQHTAALIAVVLLALIFTKFIMNRQSLKEDLAHPVLGSVVPTAAMATMVVSKTVGLYSDSIQITLWLIAVALHVVFFCAFTYYRLRDFRLFHMVPSWFVPPVGIIVAAVTFPEDSGLYTLAYILLMFGIVTYAIMLPVMLYRMMFVENVADAAKPTLAIMAAPASLSLAGYLNLVTLANPLIVAVLGGIAVLMTAMIYLSLFHLLRLPFTPGFAAYTFPLVISSVAMYKTSTWMYTKSLLAPYAHNVYIFANIEAVIATLVVSYVALHYLLVFIRYLKNSAGQTS